MTQTYPFLGRIGTILNSGQSRVLALTGNIFDWFYLASENRYAPLLDFLLKSWDVPAPKPFMLIAYEINGPIRFVHEEQDLPIVRDVFVQLHSGMTRDELAIQRLARPSTARETKKFEQDFEDAMVQAVGNPTFALEFLRQLCLASRSPFRGNPLLKDRDLIIIIEGADLLIPQGEISRLSDADRRRVGICRDWFSDPGFMTGGDSVIMLAESKGKLNEEISRLPQVLPVEVPYPDFDERLRFINWFIDGQPDERKPALWSSRDALAEMTAGLTVLSLLQMLKQAAHTRRPLRPDDVLEKVEQHLQAQLGEDVVEFSKPTHGLDDAIGNRRLKTFLRESFIPRVKRTGRGCISGAAVAGPIGSGKTFVFEAVAAELDMSVLVLKNIRSKWFGETDVVFERLRRCLEALSKVLIFMDEADTQLGGVGADVHETERRLTGKIQAMMSDSRLRGRVTWLLMTARIHLLSPDLRRPGRAGDMIIPVLDPEGDDFTDFVRWTIAPVMKEPTDAFLSRLADAMTGYYASAFGSLRDELYATSDGRPMDEEAILKVVRNRILPATARTRRIQTLHALLNCTYLSLLPGADPASARESWESELAALGERPSS